MNANDDADNRRGQMEGRVEEGQSIPRISGTASEIQLGDIRNQLAQAIGRFRNSRGRLQDKALDGAKYADKTIRENPCQAMILALGLGIIVGLALSRR